MFDHGFAGLCQWAVAAYAVWAFASSDVDDDRARFHGFDHVFTHQDGCSTSRDQGSGDHQISLRNTLGDFDFLAV